MPSTTTAADSGLLTGRARNLALTGLFLSMFVSMISMNVVGTSMPIIIADIGGTQASYTWVVVATMLASAIATRTGPQAFVISSAYSSGRSRPSFSTAREKGCQVTATSREVPLSKVA